MTRLTALLKRYAYLAQPITLAHVEACLRQDHYTGPVTFHYRNGVPVLVEAGKPISVPLLTAVTAETSPAEIVSEDHGKDLTTSPT